MTYKSLRDLPTPEPMPDIQAYERERSLCLSMSQMKQQNYDKYLANNRRNSKVDYMPIKLDIEPVSRCNFRCTMCQVSDWPKMTRARDLELNEFKKIIDEQYGLVEIKLQGMGEPLMNAIPFFEMIKYAREKHIWVRVTVNASLLHLNNNYMSLVDSGVNEIQISIDGATKEVFEGIRRGSVFNQVISNCKLINEYANKKGIAVTKMWTVVQHDNFSQLEMLVDLAHESGFKSQAFSLNLSDFGQPEWRKKNNLITKDESLGLERAIALIDQGARLGVKVSFWNVTSKYSKDSLCPWPFERAYISSDARTVPCCMIANPEVLEIDPGKSFTEAWSGSEYENFRLSHIEGRIPLACASCYE